MIPRIDRHRRVIPSYYCTRIPNDRGMNCAVGYAPSSDVCRLTVPLLPNERLTFAKCVFLFAIASNIFCTPLAYCFTVEAAGVGGGIDFLVICGSIELRNTSTCWDSGMSINCRGCRTIKGRLGVFHSTVAAFSGCTRGRLATAAMRCVKLLYNVYKQ